MSYDHICLGLFFAARAYPFPEQCAVTVSARFKTSAIFRSDREFNLQFLILSTLNAQLSYRNYGSKYEDRWEGASHRWAWAVRRRQDREANTWRNWDTVCQVRAGTQPDVSIAAWPLQRAKARGHSGPTNARWVNCFRWYMLLYMFWFTVIQLCLQLFIPAIRILVTWSQVTWPVNDVSMPCGR